MPPVITLEKEPSSSSTYGRVCDYVVVRLPMARKGSLAILDQGLISGSNFLIGILLARWLAPNQYGAYATAYSVFLLASLLYQGLMLEPQSVIGPSEYPDRPRQYLGTLLRLHCALAGSMVLILILWVWAGRQTGSSPLLSRAFVGVVVAAPCILLFWLVRDACYMRLEPERAVEGAVLYCLLLVSSLFLVYRRGLMSPVAAFLLMALGSLAATAFLLMRFRPSLRAPGKMIGLGVVARQHWKYGRWAVPSSLVVWIPWNIYYSVLGRHSGLAQAGELRALLNLFVPLGHTLNALSKVLLPYAAGKHGLHGRAGAWDRALKILLLFVCAALTYWSIVVLLQRPIFRLLYDGRFTDLGHLLPWLALASIFSFAALSTAISLRAMQEPSSVLVVYGVASAICLLVGVPAALAFGLRGVIVGLNVSSLAAFSTGILLVRAKAATQALI
jgi:O-antigen/teichoic acid export membrane protein